MITQRDFQYEAEYQEREQRRSYAEERERQRDDWLAYVRSNEAALRENRAAPALLHDLAKTYLAFYSPAREHGPEAVGQRLQNDQALTDAALWDYEGWWTGTMFPRPQDSCPQQEGSREHYLSLPFLAGLEEVERTTQEDPARWNDERIRAAVLFYYYVGPTEDSTLDGTNDYSPHVRNSSLMSKYNSPSLSFIEIGRSFTNSRNSPMTQTMLPSLSMLVCHCYAPFRLAAS